MVTLQRITSQYVDKEDRFRLCGESTGKSTVVIWMTQRLMKKLIPHLTSWLEKNPDSPRNLESKVDQRINQQLQDFAQQAARNQLVPQPAVAVQPESQTWTALSVDVSHLQEAVRLVFKGDTGETASLGMNRRELRQWLSILHGLWRGAQWEESIWPSWMVEAAPQNPGPNQKSLH